MLPIPLIANAHEGIDSAQSHTAQSHADMEATTQSVLTPPPRSEPSGTQHPPSDQIAQMHNTLQDLGQRITRQEQILLDAQQRLDHLHRQEHDLRSYLLEHAEQYGRQWSMLRTIRHQPAMQLFQTGSVLDAARASITMQHALPVLQQRLHYYTSAIERAQQTQNTILDNMDVIRRTTSKLADERTRLSESLKRRQQLFGLTDADLARLNNPQPPQGNPLSSLGELLSLPRTDPSSSLPEEATAILRRPESVRRFPLSAPIQPPMAGTVVVRYGDPFDGAPLRGIIIRGLSGAQVVATFDGRIAWAGSFGSLGKIVIIEHDGSFHTILRELGTLHVIPGQWVFAGEPVGSLRIDQEQGSSPLMDSDLYVEIRNGGQTVNPMRWLPLTSIAIADAESGS